MLVSLQSVGHGHCVSVMDSLCLSWTVCVFHGQSVSVICRLCLSWLICFFYGQPVSASLCLSQTFWAELGQNIRYFEHNLSMRFEFVR